MLEHKNWERCTRVCVCGRKRGSRCSVENACVQERDLRGERETEQSNTDWWESGSCRQRDRGECWRAETGSTRQHVCFYLTTLGSPRAQLSGCCCWRLVCSLGEGALERVVYTRVYQWLCMFNSTGFHSTTTRVRRFNQLCTGPDSTPMIPSQPWHTLSLR